MARLAVLMAVLAALAVAMMLTGRSSLASALVIGGFALGGWGVYRLRVKRGTAAPQFFGEAGEDTQHTGLGGGNPSDMPVAPDRHR